MQLEAGGLGVGHGEARLTHYRIDEDHSNAYAEWKRMGSPVAPGEKQYAAMQDASRLAPLADAPASVAIRDGSASLRFELPRQGVSLLVLDW